MLQYYVLIVALWLAELALYGTKFCVTLCHVVYEVRYVSTKSHVVPMLSR